MAKLNLFADETAFHTFFNTTPKATSCKIRYVSLYIRKSTYIFASKNIFSFTILLTNRNSPISPLHTVVAPYP